MNEPHPPSIGVATRFTLRFTLLGGVFLAMFAASMVTAMLPELERDLGDGPGTLAWAVAGYLAALAWGTAAFGRLAEATGSRRWHVLGLALFAVASVTAAAAPNAAMLVAMRVVQGAGGGVLVAVAIQALARTGEGTDARWPAALLGASAAGLGAGPAAGGLLAALAWQGPFVVVAVVAFTLLAVAVRGATLTGDAKVRQDGPGALLLALCIGLAVVGAGQSDGRARIVMLALAAVAALILVFFERRASQPLLPVTVAGRGRFWRLTWAGFTGQAVVFTILLLVPLLLAQYHTRSASGIGLRLLPFAGGLVLAAAIGYAGVSRGRARSLGIGGAWITFAGVLTMHLAGVDWAEWLLALLVTATGFGTGLLVAGIGASANSGLPETERTAGYRAYFTVLAFGAALGTSVTALLLTARADATDAFDPLFNGTAITYSDALVAAVCVAFTGFIVAMLQAPPKPAAVVEADEPMFYVLPPEPAAAWPIKPRAKPNAEQPRR